MRPSVIGSLKFLSAFVRELLVRRRNASPPITPAAAPPPIANGFFARFAASTTARPAAFVPAAAAFPAAAAAADPATSSGRGIASPATFTPDFAFADAPFAFVAPDFAVERVDLAGVRLPLCPSPSWSSTWCSSVSNRWRTLTSCSWAWNRWRSLASRSYPSSRWSGSWPWTSSPETCLPQSSSSLGPSRPSLRSRACFDYPGR